MKRLRLPLLLLLLLCVTPTFAQGDDACPAIVQRVLENLDRICEATDRNEACYGNIELEAVPREGVSDFQFSTVGDIEGVADIGALRVSGMDTEREVWGVALMRLQANLPDTLPGQNVTFLLFGDVELINASPMDSSGVRPMQAFYLRTGVAQPQCVEAPQDGLVVQTPAGRGQVTFSVNGVNMALGSTAFFRAPDGEETQIAMLEGSGAVLGANGEIIPIIAGTRVNVPLDENLQPSGPISDPEPYELDNLAGLPLNVLDREIEPVPPLEEEDVELILNFADSGLVPCGLAEFLPDCDDLVGALGGEQCDLDEAGNPDCNIDPWENLSKMTLPSLDEFDDLLGQFSNDNSLQEADATPELPEGCYFGICTMDAAEACKCVLCGVACPAETAVPAGSGEQSDVDCAASPNSPACQTAEPQSPGSSGNQSIPGNNNNDASGGDPGGNGGDPAPTDPPPVEPEPTDPPAPTEEPEPEPTDDCIPIGPICVPPPGSG